MWAALNADEHGANSGGRAAAALGRATEEAQDAQNTSMYEQALRLQQQQQTDAARAIYAALIAQDEALSRRLQYLCYKNLAALELEARAFDAALRHFASALELDGTDVVVWFQMGTAAVETGKLWLARRMLEEGFKVDASYWPLAQSLCEVLVEIGDADEYARIASHMRRHDPQCPSIRLLDAKLAGQTSVVDDAQPLSHSQRSTAPVTGLLGHQNGRKSLPGLRERRLAKRARAGLAHLEEIAREAARKRRVLDATAQATLQRQAEPVEYLLERTSWPNLGQLLLQVYDDLSADDTAQCVALASVRVTVVDRDDKLSDDGVTSEVTAVVDEELSTPAPPMVAPELSQSEAEVLSTSGRASKRKKRGMSVSELPASASAAPSDNDTQDSGFAAGEVDESQQPARRKSRRHEERLREEYAAAAKRALEKDLGYRLQEFLPADWRRQLVADTTAKSGGGAPERLAEWPPPCALSLTGSKFQIVRYGEADPEEFELLAVPNNAAVGREYTSSDSCITGCESSGSGASRQDTTEISKEQVAAFVTRVTVKKPGAVALLTAYLNQCGEWAHRLLLAGGDDSDMHSICFWAEKLISNSSGVGEAALQQSRGVSVVAATTGLRQFSTRAKLFLLELKFDSLVHQTVFGKQRRKQLSQLSQLIASADGLLLALCWAEDDEEEETERELTRLFWLLARMHERCGRSGVAKEYYVKCQETLTASIGRQRGNSSPPTTTATGSDVKICLPNQKVDAEISLAVLSERISGLESTDVRSEARRCVVAELFDQAVDLLLEHFFPNKHAPRIVELLREFEVTETALASDERRLIDTLLDAFAKSPTHDSDATQLFLVTLLFHVTTFVESLGGAGEISTGALHPEQILESGLSAAKFLLHELEASVASSSSCKYRSLLRTCCLSCLKPSLLLLFDSPRDVFQSVCAVLRRLNVGASNAEEVVESVAQTLHTIRSYDEAAFRDLFAKLPAPVNKKRQSRRDRVRVLLVDLLRFLNRHLRSCESPTSSSSSKQSLAVDKRSVLMLHCRALMKEEEDVLSRREDKTARQLFGNAAILFLLLRAASFEEDGDRTVLADLVALLHSRMGQYGICGLSYFHGDAGSALGDAGADDSCFLETSVWVLSQFLDASNDAVGSDDSAFNRELAQCYHCMYDVQLLPGCEDHKTGHSVSLLLRDDDNEVRTKRSRALRLAQFAVPILLSRPPKTNGQKKENLKLLGALRDALKDTHSMDHVQCRDCPRELQAFVSPSRLLEWGPDRFPPLIAAATAFDAHSRSPAQSTAFDAPLDHMWYLLGENFILSRVRRRGNAGELIEFEARVKERMAFLMTDVLYQRPDRVKSWIRLGKTMKELYHTVSDAWAVVLGRKRKIAALRTFAALEAEAATGNNKDGPVARMLSFDKVVVRTRLFEHMKRWEEMDKVTRDAYRVVIPGDDDSTSGVASPIETLSMEAFTLQYIVQVIEFARRCFDMAAHLAEAALRQKQEANERDSKNDRNDRNDSQDDLDEVRSTVIECNEESGLLLYNVLQEFSVLSEAQAAPFQTTTFLRVATTALSYFRTGLAVCDEMEDADEVRFRLHFMCGKTLKKQLRCQQRASTQTSTPKQSAEISTSEEPVTPRAILECFARAEKAHEDGEMEHALVHAFYALQAMRMEVVLQSRVVVADMRLVCEHYFEEEEDDDDDADKDDNDEGDGDSGDDSKSAHGSGDASGNDTADESLAGRSTDDDDGGSRNHNTNTMNTTKPKTTKSKNTANGPLKVTKDDVFKLLDRAEATRGDESKRAYHTARGWLYLNVVDALESVPNEDRYFHPSRFVLAQAVYRTSEFLHRTFATSVDPQVTALVAALEARARPLSDGSVATAAASERAAKALLPLFDKKRPQVVAIWLSEHIPAAKKFEELNQRQMKYDRYRLKYWRLYMQLLDECGAYGRLKEVGTWVLACKEEHDVIDEMLGRVLHARGNVLRARIGAFHVADELPASAGDDDSGGSLHSASDAANGSGAQSGALLKLLAKTYSYYLDVVDAQARLASAPTAFDDVLSDGEVLLAFLYLAGAVAFPDEFAFAGELAVAFVQSATESMCTFLFEGAAASRVIAALGVQWKPLFLATRALCEDKWPERSGKAKLATKSRPRAKASAPSVAPVVTATTLSLVQPDASSTAAGAMSLRAIVGLPARDEDEAAETN